MLSSLLGYELVGQAGLALGRVHDVVASRPAGSSANAPWEIDGMLIGPKAILQRAGFWPLLDEEMRLGMAPDNLHLWRDLELAAE